MPELATRLLARERGAVPEALNLVDDGRPQQRQRALRLLDALEQGATQPGAPRVGLTGPPGAGKSTLLDALVRELRSRGETVGIVAVDPSSRQSGGALLGDRARVRSGGEDPGVFIRSMAARERLGGLADAARASVAVLAAVFDRVFIETVGVGQSESDVRSLADTVVYVAQPGAGDALQFMKAGVLEHPDILLVNKLDLGPMAERTASELASSLGMSAREDGWIPPVLRASARDGTGIRELLEALAGHWRHLGKTGEIAERRRRGIETGLFESLLARFGSYGIERLGGTQRLRDRLREDVPGTSSFARLDTLEREIQEALRKESP